MQNVQFIPGSIYYAIDKLSQAALSNGHTPIHFENVMFKRYESEHDGQVTILVFEADGKEITFDADFVNNGRSGDNSYDILLKQH